MQSGKVQKPTFPQRRLSINLNLTFHVLQKSDILTCYQQPVESTRVPQPQRYARRTSTVPGRVRTERGLWPRSLTQGGTGMNRFLCGIETGGAQAPGRRR